ELCVWQGLHAGILLARPEEVTMALIADASLAEVLLLYALGELERRVLEVIIGEGLGDPGAHLHVRIFEAAGHEERLGLQRHHQRLEPVVAGGLIAGQIAEILGNRDNHGLELSPGHRTAQGGEPPPVFCHAENQILALPHCGCSFARRPRPVERTADEPNRWASLPPLPNPS